MNTHGSELVVFSLFFLFVLFMGSLLGRMHYRHDTMEGTIVCEGAESIIYDEKIYCLNKDNDQTHLNDTDIKENKK